MTPRFLSKDSEVPYFKMGVNPVGKCVTTTSLLVDSELEAFRPIIRLLHVSILGWYLNVTVIKT